MPTSCPRIETVIAIRSTSDAGNASYGAENGPLIRRWLQFVIQKESIALLPWVVLQRECDEITETSLGKVSWFGNNRS